MKSVRSTVAQQSGRLMNGHVVNVTERTAYRRNVIVDQRDIFVPVSQIRSPVPHSPGVATMCFNNPSGKTLAAETSCAGRWSAVSQR
jgi:hypothetical protein